MTSKGAWYDGARGGEVGLGDLRRIGGSLPVLLARRVWCELSEDDATHMAAGVAYYAIFSIFPLILGLLAISGMFLGSADLQQRFLSFLADNLPGSERFVVGNIESIVRFRGAAGLGAILGLLWAATAVFGAISLAVNRAWDVHEDRSFFVAKARQLGAALGVGLLFLASLLSSSAMQVFDSVLINLVWGALASLYSFLIFVFIYRFVPNCRTYWRYVWPGAAVAAALFEIGKEFFVWYLANVANYSEVYGSLASVMAFLMWTYVSALVLILGAEVSSEYERIRLGAP